MNKQPNQHAEFTQYIANYLCDLSQCISDIKAMVMGLIGITQPTITQQTISSDIHSIVIHSTRSYQDLRKV